MDQARPDDGLDEAAALANLKRGLFDASGRTEPIVLSRYMLLERIGVGGLGVVFAAYDPSLDRKVAIKLLQDRALVGEGEQLARERLAREAQAIAKLAHPNVVAVYDVGSYELPRPLEGTPPRGVFVVMEYVDGDDIDRWVAARPRPWRAVLDVYLQAGRGLEAAHHAGLVHRDFKPGNVIVGRDRRARVLDFGLARAHRGSTPVPGTITQIRGAMDPPERSPLVPPITEVGRVIGTPAYMAPEQHAGRPADARSDQFAFCVALWEGLLRQRPFAGNRVAVLAGAKREGLLLAAPPGTKVPRALLRVIARGLAADPAARWPDMGALLAALKAVPRRRRALRWGALGVATVAALAALPSLRAPPSRPLCSDFETIADELWNDDARDQLRETFARSGRPHAEASSRAVVTALDEYTAQWIRRRRQDCEAAFVRRERSPEAMNHTALCLDERLERAGELIAIFGAADGDAVDRAVDAVDALPTWSECERQGGVDAPAADEGARVLERQLLRAESLLETARPADALVVAEAARAEAERAGQVRTRAHAELVAARVHARGGRTAEAFALYYQAQASAERAGDQRTATLAVLGVASTAMEAADAPLAQRMLALAEAKIGRHELGRGLVFEAQYLRARIARIGGRLDEAVQAALDALATASEHFPSGHLAIARGHALLGVLYGDLGDSDRAAAESQRSRELYEARLGPDHPDVADQIESLATIEARHGRHDAALAGYQRALAIRERVWGPDSPRVAYALSNISSTLQTLGRIEESLVESRRALDILRVTRGEAHPETAVAASNLANVLLDTTDLAAARAMAQRAQQSFRDSVGEQHPQFAYAVATEGLALHTMERFDEATDKLTAARGLLLAHFGVDAPALPIVDKALAEAALGAGHLAAAREHIVRSIAGMHRGAHDPRDLAGALLLQAVLDGERDFTALRVQWQQAGLDVEVFDRLRERLQEDFAHARPDLFVEPGPRMRRLER